MCGRGGGGTVLQDDGSNASGIIVSDTHIRNDYKKARGRRTGKEEKGGKGRRAAGGRGGKGVQGGQEINHVHTRSPRSNKRESNDITSTVTRKYAEKA